MQYFNVTALIPERQWSRLQWMKRPKPPDKAVTPDIPVVLLHLIHLLYCYTWHTCYTVTPDNLLHCCTRYIWYHHYVLIVEFDIIYYGNRNASDRSGEPETWQTVEWCEWISCDELLVPDNGKALEMEARRGNHRLLSWLFDLEAEVPDAYIYKWNRCDGVMVIAIKSKLCLWAEQIRFRND